MGQYFAFIDESGRYQANPGRKFLRSHPFFVRGTLLISADDWKKLKLALQFFKNKHNLPAEREIKWSYIWSLEQHRRRGEQIPPDADYCFLRHHDPNELIKFVSSCLSALDDLSYCRIVITFTTNAKHQGWPENTLHRMHLQDIMQRLQMEMEGLPGDNLCLPILDPTSDQENRFHQDTFRQLYEGGDALKRYGSLIDGLIFHPSHCSVGIQMADFVAGVANGFLRDFDSSKRLFCELIVPHLRREPAGREIMGYGVREVPRDDTVRGYFRELLQRRPPAA